MNTSNLKTKKTLWTALGASSIVGALTFGLWPKAQINAKPLKPSAQTIAPELRGATWLGTPNNKPLTLAGRRGKVTVVQFWTFNCSNCLANLPSYARWNTQFAKQGVEIIGVHTPESDFERDPKNVARRVKELGITYPVLLDAKGENWNRWNQKYWPTVYLVDKAGRVRHTWIGELESGGQGGEKKVARLIQALVDEKTPVATATKGTKIMKITKTEAQWRAELSPAAFEVLRKKGTERAFTGEVHKEAGLYKCAGCDLPLFSSNAKFDSGTGWPSFFQPLKADHVEEETDSMFGMKRTEILCARCDGHLGHVFDDGPQPTGLRYCMNAVALKFEPGAK